MRELAVLVDFYLSIDFIIELKPLKAKDEVGWQLLNSLNLLSFYLSIALFAVILVSSVKNFGLDQRFKRFQDILLYF